MVTITDDRTPAANSKAWLQRAGQVDRGAQNIRPLRENYLRPLITFCIFKLPFVGWDSGCFK